MVLKWPANPVTHGVMTSETRLGNAIATSEARQLPAPKD
ncbi:hypothetical protein FLM9_1409 [Candidatus Synechococcus spongiarum]|uniref:Uncharacterized protein n=1 Tax=Candidatus Synechococcus spongiarum TaxID=431041 RepID=A0A171DHM8_9SYNE|nr:hypothetical protein FLM9_1409 [Candidatus Synechococcus spongiarum]